MENSKDKKGLDILHEHLMQDPEYVKDYIKALEDAGQKLQLENSNLKIELEEATSRYQTYKAFNTEEVLRHRLGKALDAIRDLEVVIIHYKNEDKEYVYSIEDNNK